MVTITNIRNIDYATFDEVWAIVRSLKNPGRMQHVPAISPSWDLFKQYLALRNAGQWNKESFDKIYVPTFIQEMQSAAAQRKLAELMELDKQGKHICMACFCPDEATCHRIIIAGALQYAGITVRGVFRDYSNYGEKVWF